MMVLDCPLKTLLLPLACRLVVSLRVRTRARARLSLQHSPFTSHSLRPVPGSCFFCLVWGWQEKTTTTIKIVLHMVLSLWLCIACYYPTFCFSCNLFTVTRTIAPMCTTLEGVVKKTLVWEEHIVASRTKRRNGCYRESLCAPPEAAAGGRSPFTELPAIDLTR